MIMWLLVPVVFNDQLVILHPNYNVILKVEGVASIYDLALDGIFFWSKTNISCRAPNYPMVFFKVFS